MSICKYLHCVLLAHWSCLVTRKCTPQFADVTTCPALRRILSSGTIHFAIISKYNVSAGSEVIFTPILSTTDIYFIRNFIYSDLSVVPDTQINLLLNINTC
jgi:hypothetical protein